MNDGFTQPTIKRGIYRHFKGKLYYVESIATHSETGEHFVVYRPLYGDCQLMIRPYAMFFEYVLHPDPERGGMVPRFDLEKEG